MTNTRTSRKLRVIMDLNAAINIILLLSTALLSYEVSWWFLLLPIAVHAVNDLIHWKFGWSIFNEDIQVQRCYQAVDTFLSNQIGEGLDLGFNFYDGDLTRPRKIAQEKKWEFMFNQLGLKAGDRLIDVGCGYGDWLRFARSKGVQVTGINITKEQAETARKQHGLDVKNINWKTVLKDPKLQQELYGKFDAVTFMDTMEHWVPATVRNKTSVQDQIYTDAFKFANNLLDKNSSVGRLFISCLHRVPRKWDFHRIVSAYLMNRTMCGFYPLGDTALSKNSVAYFNELNRVDRTEDYRITAVIEPEHFQTNHNVRFNIIRILQGFKWLIVDPYFVHRLIGIAADHWMSFFGTDAYSKEYNPKKRDKVTYVRLWMILFERKKNI